MYDLAVQSVRRVTAIAALLLAMGILPAMGTGSSTKAVAASPPAGSPLTGCLTQTIQHTISPRNAAGTLLPGPAMEVNAQYTVCPHAQRLSATFKTAGCNHPVSGSSASGISPNAVGTEWDHTSVNCGYDRGADTAANVFEGPSGGTFEWWYYYEPYGFYDNFDDNVYCPSPDGCTISGHVDPISNSKYTQLILYWQSPAYIGYVICD